MTGKPDGITAVLTGKITVKGAVPFITEFRELFKPLAPE
jgi:hypothetical protein